MANAHKPVLYGMIAALAAVLGVVAAVTLMQPRGSAGLQSGILLPQPRALPAFTLTDQDGQALTAARLAGSWTLLFPGFTYCPDVCPTTLALLKQVKASLGPDSALRVVFLSVDPERDTPQRLKSYVAQFDPSFVGATVAEPQLAEVARALGIAYAKVPGATPESYQMDHSAAMILLNPQAQVVAYLTPPFELPKLVADLRPLTGKAP
ncbi:SCO family protein [Solimonas sp. K1W22B-7]|uniref:SCO family protein n=1 Tax=Solimonas sp. K1W22B-7 TaxID=2303331 RepID=UPI000E33105C|nr:SCO family protein [Solimonas sp. K1W22B-7]AXQ29485.1 SCO family protein [Solimonas sp. K1W22B-7]